MAVPIDPFLYIALALGVVGGRLLSLPGRWLNALTIATVLVLIGLLGISLGATPLDRVLSVIPVALAATGVVLGVTIGVAWLLRPRKDPAPAADAPPSSRPWIGLIFLADVVLGFAIGHIVALSVGEALRFSLYALLVLVGWGLVISASRLRRLWVPLASAIVGAVAGGVFLGLVFTTYPIAFAATFGFGFYTLSGALVDARAGATLGFLAFLTNFLRENLDGAEPDARPEDPRRGAHRHGGGYVDGHDAVLRDPVRRRGRRDAGAHLGARAHRGGDGGDPALPGAAGSVTLKPRGA